MLRGQREAGAEPEGWERLRGRAHGIPQLLLSSPWVLVVHVDKAHWIRGQRFQLKPHPRLGLVPTCCRGLSCRF